MQDNQANPNDDQNHQEQNQDPADQWLSYDAVSELLPIFVLGALEPAQMLAIERYINQNQALLNRLTALEAATAQLAYTAPHAALPSHAKQRLMQRVQADVAAQARSTGANPVMFPPRPRFVARPSGAVLLPVSPRPQRRNWFGGLAQTLIRVSVAAAFILVVISAIQLRTTASRLVTELTATQTQLTQFQRQNTALQTTIQTLQQQATQLAAAQTQVAQLRAQNAQLQNINLTLQQQLQNRYTQIAVLTNAQQPITLTGTPAAPNATGAFYISNNMGVLVLHGLQPLAATQAYQLWFIPAQGDPRPSGVIQVTAATPDTLLVAISAQDQNFAVLGVTIEPASGSLKPTGALVLHS